MSLNIDVSPSTTGTLRAEPPSCRFCGTELRHTFFDYTVDRSPHKQGRHTPGTHIPILAPERIKQTKPDYVFILPWNLKNEIMAQCGYVREWGGKFVVPIPCTERRHKGSDHPQ